jgi:anti-sigma B factor antagonist
LASSNEVDMVIETEEMEDGTLRVVLHGRMDVAGVETIAIPFTSVTAPAGRRIIVDLSRVDFLASIGVRTLLQNARALTQRGGAMALFGASPVVAQVLESAGVANVVTVAATLEAALAALAAA